MAVADQRANMCHFASYLHLVFNVFFLQKVIVYNIPAVGEEGLWAYCDLVLFDFLL